MIRFCRRSINHFFLGASKSLVSHGFLVTRFLDDYKSLEMYPVVVVFFCVQFFSKVFEKKASWRSCPKQLNKKALKAMKFYKHILIENKNINLEPGLLNFKIKVWTHSQLDERWRELIVSKSNNRARKIGNWWIQTGQYSNHQSSNDGDFYLFMCFILVC